MNKYNQLDRSIWLQYVKDNEGIVGLIEMAAHIGIAKQTLSNWKKEWRAQGALPLFPGWVQWSLHEQWIRDNHSIHTQQEMADTLGVSMMALHKKMKAWGIETIRSEKDQWFPYIRDNIDKMSKKAMAVHIGVQNNTVFKWVRQWKNEGVLQEEEGKQVNQYKEYLLTNCEKLTHLQMAIYIGVSDRTVSKWLQKLTGQAKKRIIKRTYTVRQRERVIPEARAPKKMLKPEPVKLPNIVRDESLFRYIQVDARTKIQIPIEMSKEEAIKKWNEKYKKAI